MITIIGGHGRLGRAIARTYAEDAVHCVDRDTYLSWAGSGCGDDIAAYLEQHGLSDGVVFVTAGLLDPTLSRKALFEANFELPRNIIEAASQVSSRVVTFGTVMERVASAGNAYIDSKRELAGYILENPQFSALHLQIHTLYGAGEPSSFMFLGLIRDAIRRNEEFRMTQGQQLREYHHVDDDANAIRQLLREGMAGVLDLSHEKPIRLRDLAESIFMSLGKLYLLQLGALPEPAGDNFETVFSRQSQLMNCDFRETLPSVTDYMRACLAS